MPKYEDVLTRGGIVILKDGEQMTAREIADELNAANEVKIALGLLVKRLPIPKLEGFEGERICTKTIPVGESFALNGSNYRVVQGDDCSHCAFDGTVECNNAPLCSPYDRIDSVSVHFVLEDGQ